MGAHDIVVVGASAGGVEALSRLVTELPEDLPAAVLVVLHMGPHSSSALPSILARRTKLPVDQARDGEPIRPSRVYVAVPDRHLMVSGGRLRVVNGSRENGNRPSIDTLFRTAAAGYGPRVAGVVLSGTRHDGTAGLRAIHDRGGVVIVQDPDEAAFPGMPLSALAGDHPDYVVPVGAIGDLLVKLVGPQRPPERRSEPMADELDAHCFSAESLVAVPRADVESALSTAYRALDERAAVLRRLAGRAHGRHADITAEHFRAEAAEVHRQAKALRALLSSGGQAADEEESRPDRG